MAPSVVGPSGRWGDINQLHLGDTLFTAKRFGNRCGNAIRRSGVLVKPVALGDDRHFIEEIDKAHGAAGEAGDFGVA